MLSIYSREMRIVALVAGFLLFSLNASTSAGETALGVELEANRVVLFKGKTNVGAFVFRDEKILRPFFANLTGPGGHRVTRSHPPVAGSDAVDHDTMHPGLWLAFGDVSGQDFWRNKAAIQHVKFLHDPKVTDASVRWVSESQLVAADASILGSVVSEIAVHADDHRHLIVWNAEFRAGEKELVFGDQEEMGFGVRVATPIIEKNGGKITSAVGRTTAAKTWGQPAAWCDYRGTLAGRSAGVTLFAGPKNFRESWWHNRDYGLMVANPFGRAAMKQGDASRVAVRPGEPLRLQFGAALYDSADHDPAKSYEQFLSHLAR